MKERLIHGFESALGTDDRPAVERYVESGQGTPPGDASLLAWDAQSVHDYVFDTGNAIAIRGASQILKDLDERMAQGEGARDAILDIEPDQILYSGGGGGMAVVSTGAVDGLQAALHRAFAEETLVATCSVAAVSLADFESFQEAKAHLFHALANLRTLTGTDATVPVPFFCDPCQVCGRRSASREVDRGFGAGAQKRRECVVCERRIEIGKHKIGAAEESRDFEAISAPGGELAVIYLDGNRMGDTLATLESPLAYARFSQALKQCMSQVLSSTLQRYGLDDEPSGEESPETSVQEKGFQAPIQGGDDLVLIVPGDLAVPMARDLLQGFEDATDADPDLRDLVSHPLGSAAGVAVGRLPIRHLLAEAEVFLGSAKERVYREGVRSCVDFGLISDGQARRSGNAAPRLRDSVESLIFSGKPYDLEEMDRFCRRRKRFLDPKQGLAPSQMHACRRMAEAGPHQLRNHLLYQIGRHAQWKELVCGLAESKAPLTDPDSAFSTFVPTYGKHRVFDLADMLELRDLWTEPKQETAS